jgi:4-hydroxy-tetrahydrodipicolinate synthase
MITLPNPAPLHANAFQGIWPALLTPLTANLQIDHAKLAAHCRSLLARGCQGVTLFGTTGEGPSFSLLERIDTLNQLIASGFPADRIMVSTSCAALPETLELTVQAVRAGVHGCLMLPPFFIKGVSDAGVIDCYRQVIDGTLQALSGTSTFRMYLYHIPQVTGVGLSHAVIRAVKEAYPDIVVGIKDSQCDTAHSIALAEAFSRSLAIYVGFEPDLPEMGKRGTQGAVSGLANFIPRLVDRLVMQAQAPGTVRERERVVELLALLAPYSLIPALKSVMASMSGDRGWLRVRAPLVALTDAEFTALDIVLRGLAIDPARD